MDSKKNIQLLYRVGSYSLNPEVTRITVGSGTCGEASGASEIFDTISKSADNLGVDCEIVSVGCRGMCWAEPLVEVSNPGSEPILYGEVNTDLATRIVEGIKAGTLPTDNILSGVAFWDIQERRIMKRCGIINPFSLSEYVATDGYLALSTVLSQNVSPLEVVKRVEESGLRGRGGAGYPTGRKWRTVAEKESSVKYVVANGDEGDPGAFMDRCLMESDPFAIVEGLTISGYATGAEKGYIFVRSEYPKAVDAIQNAISCAKEAGLLGRDILGSGWSFEIGIVKSAGAYVCGEATALIHAMEGGPGKPRKKPPHTSDVGLWGKPTCINNVETLANIPQIILKGTQWFRSLGTQSSPGTKVFSIAGAIDKVGLVEVPLGIGTDCLIDVLSPQGNSHKSDFDSTVGQSPDRGKNDVVIKTIQVGGPSGIFLPKNKHFALDYESLSAVGGSIGSGGLTFVGNDDCIVDMAKYFMYFSAEEDCGQCRRSKALMDESLEILKKITAGNGSSCDIERLRTICEDVPKYSLCAHGKMSVNPLRSSLNFFEDEYLSHLEGKCPAYVCKDLISFSVIPELCPGCRCCAPVCPTNAMQGRFGKPYSIVDRLCIRCKMCISSCPYHAVEVVNAASRA